MLSPLPPADGQRWWSPVDRPEPQPVHRVRQVERGASAATVIIFFEERVDCGGGRQARARSADGHRQGGGGHGPVSASASGRPPASPAPKRSGERVAGGGGVDDLDRERIQDVDLIVSDDHRALARPG